MDVPSILHSPEILSGLPVRNPWRETLSSLLPENFLYPTCVQELTAAANLHEINRKFSIL